MTKTEYSFANKKMKFIGRYNLLYIQINYKPVPILNN